MGLGNYAGILAGGSNSARNWFGGALNDITGRTESAKLQYKHQLALQKDAQEFSKWQMANAHQMEIEDLKKAGLNPVLSAGGTGASAGVSMGSAGDGGAGINPFEMIKQAVDSMNSSKITNAQAEKLQADIKNETARTQAEIAKEIAETRNITTRTPQMENDEKFAKTWWGRNISPALRDIFGGGGGAVAAGAAAGGTVAKATTAKKAAKRPITNIHYH